MAILIPRDLDCAAGVPPHELRVAGALQSSLPDEDWIWYNAAQHSARPRFVILSRRHGIVGVDTYDWSPRDMEGSTPSGLKVAGRLCDPVSDLGRRLEAVRQQLREIRPSPPLAGLIMLPNLGDRDLREPPLCTYLTPGVAIPGDGLTNTRLPKVLPQLPQRLEETLVGSIRAHLYPETGFERPRHVQDENRAQRTTIRFQLDADQEAIARSLGSGITFVVGVSGSGKSLVLCARARYLASAHPDWTVQLLCFNRTLVGYLQALIGPSHKSVQVDTFYRWASRLGIRLPWARDAEVAEKADEVIRRAISRGAGTASCDAILIDEGQDFAPSWLALSYHALRPGQGGMVIASDEAQCIYRDAPTAAALPTAEVTTVFLHRNYRNTAQIGHFALEAVFGAQSIRHGGRLVVDTDTAPQTDFALSGEPVQVVWAERWDAQAEFIAREIRRLVAEEVGTYHDIAILYTQRAGMVSRILSALDGCDIPHFWVNRDKESKAGLDPNGDLVKVMTVHSAKGMEFPIVFVFGLEALPAPAQLNTGTAEEAHRTRVAYVGMTRAQDILYLTYTRSNPIIERALQLKEWCEYRAYPDDFAFD